MTEREPIETTSLDVYGSPALPWSRPGDVLASTGTGPDVPFFLGTVHSDGHPCSAGIGALWHEDDMYFTS